MELDKIQLKLIKKYRINLYLLDKLIKNEIGIVSFPGAFDDCEIKKELLKQIFDVIVPEHLYNDIYNFPLKINYKTFWYQFKHVNNEVYFYNGFIGKREKEVTIHSFFMKEKTLKDYNKLSNEDFKKNYYEKCF
jgi:hypothetical protein